MYRLVFIILFHKFQYTLFHIPHLLHQNICDYNQNLYHMMYISMYQRHKLIILVLCIIGYFQCKKHILYPHNKDRMAYERNLHLTNTLV